MHEIELKSFSAVLPLLGVWIITETFIKSNLISFPVSLALIFSLLTYRKRFKRIRILKPYIFLITGIVAMSPNISLLAEAINRENNPCGLIHPYSEEVCKIRDDIFPYKNNNYTINDVILVQMYVYKMINYSYDLPNWGLSEYLSTPEETIEKGKEDCDGLAILACSILRSMDLDAWVVCGIDHMWVRVVTKNSFEDYMGPRPPIFFMFNEKTMVYSMSDTEIFYNRLFPAYASLNEIALLTLVIDLYLTFFITLIPEDCKKDESFRAIFKRTGLLKLSRHLWMAALSLLTILAFGLILIRITQLYYISLLGLTSIGLVTVDRMKEEYTKKLCFAMALLVLTLLCFNMINVTNAILNSVVIQFL